MDEKENNSVSERPKQAQAVHMQAFSSPTSSAPEHETRILTEYISMQNLVNIAEHNEALRKTLFLKKFFMVKRNQFVSVSSLIKKNQTKISEGKVDAIGRDFVLLTNLKKRIWIPYTAIHEATIPFGYPNYSSPHQHFIYDNDLQRKLVLEFGETVCKKQALIQQFFQESLQTSLSSWKGTWVEVRTPEQRTSGKISETTAKELILHSFKTKKMVLLKDIQYISTIRMMAARIKKQK
ncbi:hypothetical protein [Domibacillus tundrae]|uniref:hypothetical protein n=1 Tax=Domibacillus tundrae TaxID=1587527 RepID=UPI000A76224F|nr:hypothetical protein [Domibacillus tundrae]